MEEVSFKGNGLDFCGLLHIPSLVAIIGRSPQGAFWTSLSCSTTHFSPTSWPSGRSVVHHRGRGHSLAVLNVTLLILVLEIPFNFNSICNVLGMPILMSVSKTMQVFSKFYFHDTLEQDQRAWEQQGLIGPISTIRLGLPCGQGWGGNFSHGQPPKNNSVGFGVVWVTGLFSLWGLSVGYETWPPIGWRHSFVIGWSKDRLGLPSAPLH